MPEKSGHKSTFRVTFAAFKLHNSGILKTELESLEKNLKNNLKRKKKITVFQPNVFQFKVLFG